MDELVLLCASPPVPLPLSYMQAHTPPLPCRSPDMLYERVVEVDELVVLPLGAEPSQRNGRDAETSARCVRGGKGAERNL